VSIWACVSLALLAGLFFWFYLKTLLTARRVVREFYDIEDRWKALLSILFPWRVMILLREDLRIKNKALLLAARLGLDVKDLLQLAYEEDEEI